MNELSTSADNLFYYKEYILCCFIHELARHVFQGQETNLMNMSRFHSLMQFWILPINTIVFLATDTMRQLDTSLSQLDAKVSFSSQCISWELTMRTITLPLSRKALENCAE